MWGMRARRCQQQRNQVSMPLKKLQTKTLRILRTMTMTLR